MDDQFLAAAISEARQGLREGGIPIGSVIVHGGEIIGRGHNRRVQRGSVTLHAEMDALENAGRQPASVYRESVLYTTLSPCCMCSFDLPTGPDYVVLYQKNIEAVCSTEAEIRDQIRRTVIHEFGRYFGMDEEQLKDV